MKIRKPFWKDIKKLTIISLVFTLIACGSFALYLYNDNCYNEMGASGYVEQCHAQENFDYDQSEARYERLTGVYYSVWLISITCMLISLCVLFAAHLRMRREASLSYAKPLAVLAIMSTVLAVIFRILYHLYDVYSTYTWYTISQTSFLLCILMCVIGVIAGTAAITCRVCGSVPRKK